MSTVRRALKEQKPSQGLTSLSDYGTQYTSKLALICIVSLTLVQFMHGEGLECSFCTELSWHWALLAWESYCDDIIVLIMHFLFHVQFAAVSSLYRLFLLLWEGKRKMAMKFVEKLAFSLQRY